MPGGQDSSRTGLVWSGFNAGVFSSRLPSAEDSGGSRCNRQFLPGRPRKAAGDSFFRPSVRLHRGAEGRGASTPPPHSTKARRRRLEIQQAPLGVSKTAAIRGWGLLLLADESKQEPRRVPCSSAPLSRTLPFACTGQARVKGGEAAGEGAWLPRGAPSSALALAELPLRGWHKEEGPGVGPLIRGHRLARIGRSS